MINKNYIQLLTTIWTTIMVFYFSWSIWRTIFDKVRNRMTFWYKSYRNEIKNRFISNVTGKKMKWVFFMRQMPIASVIYIKTSSGSFKIHQMPASSYAGKSYLVIPSWLTGRIDSHSKLVWLPLLLIEWSIYIAHTKICVLSASLGWGDRFRKFKFSHQLVFNCN